MSASRGSRHLPRVHFHLHIRHTTAHSLVGGVIQHSAGGYVRAIVALSTYRSTSACHYAKRQKGSIGRRSYSSLLAVDYGLLSTSPQSHCGARVPSVKIAASWKPDSDSRDRQCKSHR